MLPSAATPKTTATTTRLANGIALSDPGRERLCGRHEVHRLGGARFPRQDNRGMALPYLLEWKGKH